MTRTASLLLLVCGLAACGKKETAAPPDAAASQDGGVVDDRAARVKRLEDLRARLGAPGVATGSLGAYAQFQDALSAAGLARSLGEKDAYVRQLLLSASNSAMGVVPKPEGEGDTSASTAPTLINALYAALASQHMDGIHRFAGLRPAAYDSTLSRGSPFVKTTALTLQAAARGDRKETAKRSREALALPAANPSEKSLYTPQLEALAAWSTGTPMPLDAVQSATRTSEETQGHPDLASLELPVLGLRALR